MESYFSINEKLVEMEERFKSLEKPNKRVAKLRSSVEDFRNKIAHLKKKLSFYGKVFGFKNSFSYTSDEEDWKNSVKNLKIVNEKEESSGEVVITSKRKRKSTKKTLESLDSSDEEPISKFKGKAKKRLRSSKTSEKSVISTSSVNKDILDFNLKKLEDKIKKKVSIEDPTISNNNKNNKNKNKRKIKNNNENKSNKNFKEEYN